MLWATLVQMIEDHADAITLCIVRRLRRDSQLSEIGSLPEAELRSRAQEILKNLGRWLATKDAEIGSRYEELGRRRFKQSVPLHEIVYALLIIKEEMIDFVRDQGLAQAAVQIYAEEQLEYSVDRFDRVIYHFVRGYEDAWRQAAAQEFQRTRR